MPLAKVSSLSVELSSPHSNSPTLSGAQASSTQNNSHRTDLRHYEMYRINDIVSEWTKEDSALKTEDDCQRAMVMVALLGGGDYVPEGAGRMGELARRYDTS